MGYMMMQRRSKARPRESARRESHISKASNAARMSPSDGYWSTEGRPGKRKKHWSILSQAFNGWAPFPWKIVRLTETGMGSPIPPGRSPMENNARAVAAVKPQRLLPPKPGIRGPSLVSLPSSCIRTRGSSGTVAGWGGALGLALDFPVEPRRTLLEAKWRVV